MDWVGTSDEEDKTVELAVIKVEATVPVTDPSYGGAVVLNPGKCFSQKPDVANVEASKYEYQLNRRCRRTGQLGRGSSNQRRSSHTNNVVRWTGGGQKDCQGLPPTFALW